jgi:hypothetical protein
LRASSISSRSNTGLVWGLSDALKDCALAGYVNLAGEPFTFAQPPPHLYWCFNPYLVSPHCICHKLLSDIESLSGSQPAEYRQSLVEPRVIVRSHLSRSPLHVDIDSDYFPNPLSPPLWTDSLQRLNQTSTSSIKSLVEGSCGCVYPESVATSTTRLLAGPLCGASRPPPHSVTTVVAVPSTVVAVQQTHIPWSRWWRWRTADPYAGPDDLASPLPHFSGTVKIVFQGVEQGHVDHKTRRSELPWE